VTDDEQHEADQQEREGDGHRAVNAHRADPKNYGEERPGDEKPADVGMRDGKHTKVICEQHQAEADPERAITREGAVTEAVPRFHFLKAGDKLGETAENQAEPDDGTVAHPAYVMELEDEGGQAEPGETDNRRIGMFVGVRSVGVGHDMKVISGRVWAIRRTGPYRRKRGGC